MTGRSYASLAIVVLGFIAAVWSVRWLWEIGGPYGEGLRRDPRVRITQQGRYQELAADTDGDLLIDTWSYSIDGRLERTELDEDRNGTRDRRWYFRPDGKIDRVEALAK